MIRWRLWTLEHGAVELLAPDEARAWARFRSAYPDATVLGAGPQPMGAAGQRVTLTEVLATVRREGAA